MYSILTSAEIGTGGALYGQTPSGEIIPGIRLKEAKWAPEPVWTVSLTIERFLASEEPRIIRTKARSLYRLGS